MRVLFIFRPLKILYQYRSKLQIKNKIVRWDLIYKVVRRLQFFVLGVEIFWHGQTSTWLNTNIHLIKMSLHLLKTNTYLFVSDEKSTTKKSPKA